MRIDARLVATVIALSIGGVVGCSSSTTPSSATSEAAGTYALTTINGAALPVTTVPSGINANCTGITDTGTLVLSTSGSQSYTMTLNAHFVCATPPINNVTSSESGSWAATTGQVTFTPRTNQWNLSSGTLSGSTLTVLLDAPSYAPSGVSAGRVTTVWRKQ